MLIFVKVLNNCKSNDFVYCFLFKNILSIFFDFFKYYLRYGRI